MSNLVFSERSKVECRNENDAAFIYIVDDHPSYRGAMVRMLKAAGYTAVPFASGQSLLDDLPRPARGCILLDVEMPGLRGPDLQDKLLQLGCELPIIFVTAHGDLPTSVRSIKAGAEDFLGKPASEDIILSTIERALHRYDASRAQAAEVHRLRSRFNILTPREREVLGLVVEGKLNKQIAFRLGTSERTIKAHRHSITQKLAVRSVAELVTLTDRIRWLAPDTSIF